MTQVIKVYTPIKRVPTMIGKAQNGQKLPFGPYTLPQVAGVTVTLVITAVLALTLPANPAVTFIVGLIVTVLVAFGLGLIPYTGIRMTSRIYWIARLIFVPQPASASGMPVTAESAEHTVFVDQTVVVILPDHVTPPQPVRSMAGGPLAELLGARRDHDTITVKSDPLLTDRGQPRTR